MCSLPANLATPTVLSLQLAVLFIETTVLCPGFDSPLYIHIPPLFQVELEWE